MTTLNDHTTSSRTAARGALSLFLSFFLLFTNSERKPEKRSVRPSCTSLPVCLSVSPSHYRPFCLSPHLQLPAPSLQAILLAFHLGGALLLGQQQRPHLGLPSKPFEAFAFSFSATSPTTRYFAAITSAAAAAEFHTPIARRHATRAREKSVLLLGEAGDGNEQRGFLRLQALDGLEVRLEAGLLPLQAIGVLADTLLELSLLVLCVVRWFVGQDTAGKNRDG